MIHNKSNIPINRKRNSGTTAGVLKRIFLILLFAGSLSQLKAQSFVHPGIPFTSDDLNQLKTNIVNGKEPWTSLYASFASSSYSSLNYGMQGPFATVGRAPDVHLTQWQNDMRAIFHLSLMSVFTSNTAYAAKATAILDSWATTNTRWEGEETFLALGDYSEYFVTGADILKSTYSGWTAANTSHVNSYFNNVIWPELDVPNPVRPMNQGCIQLKAALSVAVFLDDAVKWNQAINSYRTDVGGGLYNSLPNGQIGDAGRDEGHWRGGVQALIWGAEVAWKQGVDLFSEMDNRLLKICELYCRYHLSTSNLTFIPFGGPYAYYTGWADDGSPKSLFNAYNIISNAYTNRKGISTPFTDRFIDLKGNDIYTFLFLKSSDNSTATQPEAVIYPKTSAITSLTSADVGTTGIAGSTTYNNGVWTIQGAGSLPVPPNSSVDAFHFSFQKVTDDASIIARVTSIENTGDNVRVGIMMRESLAVDAKYVGLFMPAGGGMLATWRGASAWSKTSTSWNTPATKGLQTNPGGIPQWLKLVRRGTRVALLHSNDSINWSGVAEAEIALPSTTYIGLVVASNSTSKLNTSTFSNISITNTSPAGSPVISSSLGASGSVGSAFSYTVTGTNAPVSFGATDLPDGLSINAATGVISGTPTAFGTSYTTITATNANGTASAVLKIEIANSVAPSAPLTVTAVPVNTYSVGLSWSASPGASSYSIKHSAVSGGPYAIIASNITDTTFVDDAALPKANYYVVEAFSGSLESTPSTEVLITLLPDISDSVVVSGGVGNVTINWAAADGATSYNVKRSSATGGPYTTIATGVTATTYTDNGLTNGQVYYYVISSVSDAGESENSVEKSGTPGSTTVKWAASPTTGNWNLGSNWEGSAVPPTYASLVFGASSSATLTNDMDSLKVSKLIFNADAPAYTIGGNVLMPGTEITNNSSSLQTINTPLTLRNVLAVNSNTGSTQLLGAISGTGSITINNTTATGSTIGGSNTYSGGTTVYGSWNGVWGTPSYALNIMGTGTGAIGAPTGGAFGTGPVYLKGGCLVNSGYAKIYNDVYLATNTNNYAITNPGGMEFAGRFIGDGNFSLECSYGYPYYTFSGDNSAFTGKFTTIKRTSFFRMAITSAAAGSAKAKWEFNPNFSADCLRLQFNGTIEFGEFAGVGSMHAFGGASPILSIGALNTDATYGGTASDGTSFVKVGTGTQRFVGVNTYWGTTTVQSGKFYVNNDFASPVTVNGGIFGGVGLSSASVTVNNGGTLSPGDDGLGIFTTTNTLTAATGATLAIEISSSNVTSDGIVASGVTLNNATLSLTDINSGTLPTGTNFTLINNTGSAAVVGTFNGLPEYSTITIGNYNFQITYKGGTGNDIVLLDERTVPAYITSAATGVISVGQSFTYTLTSNRTILSSSATGLPQGLTINSTTGVISGTPTSTGVYAIAISAVTDKGTTTGTLVLTVNTNAVPSTPAGLAASNAGLAKALLTWNKLSTTQLVTGYSIKRSTTSGGPYTTVATGVTDTTYTDTGLSYNVTYYYVVSASNSFGESTNSGQTTVTTLSPPVPSAVSSLSAVNGNAKINLRWSPNKYTESFTVKRSTVSGGSYTTIATAVTDTSYVDNTVSNATTYYYVVTAKNISGESANSNEAVATPESTAYNWWPFNETTGSSIADVWGGKTATLNAGTRVPGIQGSAINLAGTSTNYVSLPSGIVSSLTNFTISVWVKPTTITNWMRLFDFGSGTTNYMFFAMSTGSTPRYAIRTPSVGEKVINSSVALTTGKWSHIAITQSGSTAMMYINGVVVGSNTAMTLSPSSLGNTTLNYIGKSQFSNDPYLNASVDDFRIYGRSLTASEISSVMNTEVLKAPTNVVASGAYKNVSVSWTASAKATAYNVKRSTTSGGPYSTIGAGITATSYIDTTALMANYYYVVTSISGSNESFVSNEASVAITSVPNVPAVPSSVAGIPGNAKVTLTWRAASDAAVYRVKRASVTGGPYTLLGVTSTTSYVDNTTSNGVTYYYVVSAKNVSGESANSAEVSATPFTYAWSYWPMNENTGTTTADYWSTRTGTLNGGTGISWTTGVSGSGILFNPASSTPYVSMPSGIVSTLTDFTISAWVKPNALSTWSRVFDFGTSTSNYMFLSVSNGSVPRFAIRTASVAENGINSSTALQAGKWAHMVVTQAGTTAIMYINGVEVGRNSAMALTPSSMGTTTQNYFGKSQWADPYLNGVLDDIRIYNKSLSTSEIVALVNEFAPAKPSTVTAAGSYKNVLVNWTSSSGASSYNVKRATVSGGPYTTLATGVTALSYTDATATYGTYYYVVTSSSADNKEGVPSDEATVLLPPAAIANARATGWNSRIDLSWAASSGASSYNVKRSDVSGGPYTLVSTVTTTAYNDATVSNGTAYYYSIEAVGTGGSSVSNELSATPISNALSNTWKHADVGAVGITGNAQPTDSTFTLYGSGSDIYFQTDMFQFAYQRISGNVGIVTRIADQQNTRSYARAGVTIRDTVTTNAIHATLTNTPTSIKEFISRTATTSNAVEDIVSNQPDAKWLRLVRKDTVVSAYYSQDGINWLMQNSKTIKMRQNAYVG
ncbi:MAG TPA: LamG-like jellyroll fold domain-containing protein, partial [Cyclobacteriaceae bacterium]